MLTLRRVDNPPNPYLSEHREWLEPPPEAKVEVYEETSGSILSHNNSPDLPFAWSVNPYRGCQHACSYCYARPYHEYLGFGAGTDFETKLIVKLNAPELLEEAFRRSSWKGERVNFSGITDCYQPLEAGYGLTRRCLEVCVTYRNPVVVVTKGTLVVRDADVLAELNSTADTLVQFSIPFADPTTAKLIEPQAPTPAARFKAMHRLSEAGVPVGVIISPVIPGLNDRDIPRILEQAAQAGATSAGFTALRLPGSVEEVFVKRLGESMPLRVDRIMNRIRDMRGGLLTDTRFGKRMGGRGAYWESIRELFRISKTRYGLDERSDPPAVAERTSPPDTNQEQLAFDFLDRETR